MEGHEIMYENLAPSFCKVLLNSVAACIVQEDNLFYVKCFSSNSREDTRTACGIILGYSFHNECNWKIANVTPCSNVPYVSNVDAVNIFDN